MAKIYTATSWKNEVIIRDLAIIFRDWGHEVYCFAEQKETTFNWQDIVTPCDDGITALKTDLSRRAFELDYKHMEWADTCILLLPSGRDSHIEAGFIKGRGGRVYILGVWKPGEYSLTYHIADGLIRINEEVEMYRLRDQLRSSQ